MTCFVLPTLRNNSQQYATPYNLRVGKQTQHVTSSLFFTSCWPAGLNASGFWFNRMSMIEHPVLLKVGSRKQVNRRFRVVINFYRLCPQYNFCFIVDLYDVSLFLCLNCWSKGSCYRRNSAGRLLATGTTTNDQLLLVS